MTDKSTQDDRSTVLSPPAVPRWTWTDVVLLVAVLAIATAIRLARTDPSFSFDELWHIATTRGEGNSLALIHPDTVYHDRPRATTLAGAPPFWHVWTGMQGVLHPPLFVMALRVWRDVVGESDAAAHGFSLAWSLVAITFCFAAARLAMDRWVACVAALGIGCSQTQVYLAQEVRPYEMLIGIGSVALWLMTRIEVLGPTRRRVIALGLLTLPLQLTHYFAFGAAMAMAAYGLIRSGRYRWWFIGALTTSGLIFIVGWVPFALQQVKDLETGDVFMRTPRDIVRESLFVAATPFRIYAERDYLLEKTPVVSGVLFILPWLLVRRFKPLLPWALWLWFSIGALVALDMARSTSHVSFVRYLSIASPAVPLLFAGVLWSLGKTPGQRRAYAMVISVALVGMGGDYLLSRNIVPGDAPDFRDVAVGLERHIAPGEAIVTYESAEAGRWHADAWMLEVGASQTLLPRTIAVLTKPISPENLAALGTRRLWLVYGELDLPIDVLVPGARVLEEIPSALRVHTVHLEIADDRGPSTVPATRSAASGAATPSR